MTVAPPPVASNPMIAVTGLKKAFGRKVVLDGVDVEIGRGESLVVLGGSGSGKSVLLKSIIGIVPPDGGSIRIDGTETVGIGRRDRERVNARVGMLFQGGALFDSLRVWENVAFGLTAGKHMDRRQAKEIAIEKLRQVGLGPDVGELLPVELSGGMQKRVALARAIATDPEIIFFDEPTTGLDPIMADVINSLIVDCVRKLGASTLTITHDMTSMRKIADRVALLYRGKLVWTGPVAEVDRSGNPYVDQFVNGRAEGPIEMQVQI